MRARDKNRLLNTIKNLAGKKYLLELELKMVGDELEAASKKLNRQKEPKRKTKLFLIDNGPNRILVIKAIREITNLGLKEAKDITDCVMNAPGKPTLIKDFAGARAPNELAWAETLLKQAGAQVRIA